jgi:DNA-binding phage protein
MKGFNQAGRQVLESLHKMKSPEMRPLTTFLQEVLKDTTAALITANADTVQRLQGRAAVLKEMTEAIENAAPVMEKLNK